jgi:uncharacterized protein (DUF1778 family)
LSDTIKLSHAPLLVENIGRSMRSTPRLNRPGIGCTSRDKEIEMAKAASKPTRGRARAQRLEARVTAEQRTLIERAAALQGRTVTDFVLTSVQDAARRAIKEHQQLELSVRDSQVFVEALLNPKPVDDRLRETVRRYRETTGI